MSFAIKRKYKISQFTPTSIDNTLHTAADNWSPLYFLDVRIDPIHVLGGSIEIQFRWIKNIWYSYRRNCVIIRLRQIGTTDLVRTRVQ